MSTQWSKYQQAVFDWHDSAFDGKGKAVSVRSGAGSGKTTTLVEAGKSHIPPTLKDALSLAFNSDIAKVLKAKYEGTNIDARTPEWKKSKTRKGNFGRKKMSNTYVSLGQNDN